MEAMEDCAAGERRNDLIGAALEGDDDARHDGEHQRPEERERKQNALGAIGSERSRAATVPQQRTEESGHHEKRRHAE